MSTRKYLHVGDGAKSSPENPRTISGPVRAECRRK